MFFRDTKPDPKYYPDLRILRIRISPSTSEFLLGHSFFDTGKSSSVNQMESYPVQPPKRLTICQRILDVDAEKTLAT
jgi:CTP:phosphocholine cytidylyltransferase-like protein